MKYMGKRECAPEGMNPTFMLASRKNGGIGSAYAEKLRAFYEQQPGIVTGKQIGRAHV